MRYAKSLKCMQKVLVTVCVICRFSTRHFDLETPSLFSFCCLWDVGGYCTPFSTESNEAEPNHVFNWTQLELTLTFWTLRTWILNSLSSQSIVSLPEFSCPLPAAKPNVLDSINACSADGSSVEIWSNNSRQKFVPIYKLRSKCSRKGAAICVGKNYYVAGDSTTTPLAWTKPNPASWAATFNSAVSSSGLA